MIIALRGMVDLFRKADRAFEVHRRALAFSISHGEHNVRIYAHYPEINGDTTTYWRETIKLLNFNDGNGKVKWTCFQFTLNVYQLFAPALLTKLKATIDHIPTPTQPTLEATSLDDLGPQSSQDDASAPDSQNEYFRKLERSTGRAPYNDPNFAKDN